MSPVEMDEPIEMPYLGQPKNHVLDVGAHWHRLVNTVE